MLLLGEITLPDSQISVFEALTRNLSIILDEKVWQFKAVKLLSCRKEHSSASVKKQDQNSLLISVISFQILQRDYVSLNIYLRNMQLKTNCFFAPKRISYLLPGFVSHLTPKCSCHKHLMCEMKPDLFVFILTNFKSFIIALYKKY